jgi:uncharacterized protein involved in outer membrane biogenesis
METTKKKRPGGIALWTAVLAGIFGLYCLTAGVIVPHFARPFLERALSEETGVRCTVKKLRVNPLTWKIIAKDVSVPYPHFAPGVTLPDLPEQDFISLERLELFVRPSSLTEQTLIIEELRLVKPSMAVTRLKDGSLSPQYLFPGRRTGTEEKENTSQDENGDIFPLIMRNIIMQNGSLLFKDELGGATYTVKNLGAVLPFASTLAEDKETTLTPTITALVNGQTLTITGEARPFAKTRQTVFTLKTRDLSLPELRGYMEPYTSLVLEKGTLHTALTLRLGLDAEDALQLALAGTVEVADLELTGPQGVVFETKHAYVDMENVLLGPRRVVINEAVFENPKTVLRRGKDGALDWASFFSVPEDIAATDVRIVTGEGTELPKSSKPEDAREESLPLQLIIGRAKISGGTVEWYDASVKTPVRYVAENIEAAFTDLSTEGNGKANFALSFGKGKEQASMTGSATTSPLRADTSVTLKNIALSPFAPYIEEDNGIKIQGGLVDASGDISFRLETDTATPSTIQISRAALSIANAQVKDARHTATPLVALKKMEAANASLDLAAKTLSVAKISGTGLAANIVRGKNGDFLLPERQGTPAQKQGKQKAANAKTQKKTWKIAVSSVQLEKSTLSFVDSSLAKTASIPLANVTVTGKEFANFDNKQWSVTVAGKPGTQGDLSITAKGTLAPLNLTFSGKLDKADIRPLSPYLQESTQLTLAEASLGGDFTGALKYVKKSKRGMDFSINGNLRLYGISLLYEQRELIGWGRMRTEKFAYRAPADGGRSLAAASVTVNAPRLSVTIDDKGVNSITKALRTPGKPSRPDEKKTPAQSAETEKFLAALSINTAAIKQGEATYVDLRVSPPYALQVNRVDLSLKKLSFDPKKNSPFTAALFINGSPVNANGALTSIFDSPSGNGTVSIRSLDISRFTQYAAKYLGYSVKKGELSADITASLKGKRLAMRNKLVIKGLELGKKTNSPYAADMPLPTAVAALRDMSGVISLDLPVSGTIGDPQFKISGIVSQMLGNVMVKTVTTPFTLLGGLVTGIADIFTGGSGPKEARIVFVQGNSSLDKSAESALQKVGKELKKYGSAKISITGTADMAEKSLLVDSWVKTELKKLKYDKLPVAQKQKTSPERVVVSSQYNAKEYTKLLFELYNSLSFVKNSKEPDITSPGSTRAVMHNIRTHYPMTETELLLLADARANAVYKALTSGNTDVAPRIRILPSKIMDSAKTGDRLESYAHIEAVK